MGYNDLSNLCKSDMIVEILQAKVIQTAQE